MSFRRPAVFAFPRRRFISGRTGVALLSTAAATGLLIPEETWNKRLDDLIRWRTIVEDRLGDLRSAQGFSRFIRSSYNAAIVAWDYKSSLRGLDEHSDEYKRIQKDCHLRAAKRLLSVCRAHGGLYNKFGQYIATLNHILPDEYVTTLSVLHDKAQHLPWNDIEKVIRQDLGGSFEEHFAAFEEEPIAAASLAQVHRAVRRSDLQEVAVKLQYPGLRAQVKGDTLTMKVLLWCLGKAFPAYEYTWLFPEFEHNMRMELDFAQEGYNADRLAKMFAHREDVHVPKVDWTLTTPRVLTMEFIKGLKVTDKDALEKAGIHPKDVAHLVCEVFGQMMHIHGFVHCDPHPGNLMVRPMGADSSGAAEGSPPKGVRPQLVVLDHGMYRRLEPSFRHAYSRLWKALVMQDEHVGRQACVDLNLDEDAFDMLSLILTFRPTKSKFTKLGQRMHEEDRKVVKEKFKKTTAEAINDFLKSLPRDILYIFRTTNIVRSLNLELGGTSRDRFRVMGQSAIQGLFLDNGGVLPVIDKYQAYYAEQKRAQPQSAKRLIKWGDVLGDFFKFFDDFPDSSSSGEIVHSTCGRQPLGRQPRWYELPGAATMNFPVASEFPSAVSRTATNGTETEAPPPFAVPAALSMGREATDDHSDYRPRHEKEITRVGIGPLWRWVCLQWETVHLYVRLFVLDLLMSTLAWQYERQMQKIESMIAEAEGGVAGETVEKRAANEGRSIHKPGEVG